MEAQISRNLGVPYVELIHDGEKKYLCSNGVLFKDSEYQNYEDLQKEYERREKEETLYDYDFAKSTGILRKKENYKKTEEVPESNEEVSKELHNNDRNSPDNITPRTSENTEVYKSNERSNSDRWNESSTDKYKEAKGNTQNVFLIILILAFASVCSMYESTLHTATYLFDYVDKISAWLLSTAVTAYNSSAFEVSVMFHTMKRNFMAFIFMLLWAMVTLFSMATTVSVFYDRFNFNETQIAEENKEIDSNKLRLELLRTKEKDLREAIEFKKKDIEYRQEREYATTAVRLELENLQKELQKNLSEQQELLSETPEVIQEKLQRKESLFAFLGRMIGLEGGILEFIMSVLSAVFINLISPLSLTAVIELNRRKDKK